MINWVTLGGDLPSTEKKRISQTVTTVGVPPHEASEVHSLHKSREIPWVRNEKKKTPREEPSGFPGCETITQLRG